MRNGAAARPPAPPRIPLDESRSGPCPRASSECFAEPSAAAWTRMGRTPEGGGGGAAVLLIRRIRSFLGIRRLVEELQKAGQARKGGAGVDRKAPREVS